MKKMRFAIKRILFGLAFLGLLPAIQAQTSEAGELKYAFRYPVVWKKEGGTWKLYRDIGL